MDAQWQLLVIVAAGIAIIGILVWMVRAALTNQIHQQAVQLEESNREVGAFHAVVAALQQQLEEERERSLVVARSVNDLKKLIEQFDHRLSDLKQQDPNVRLYQRASDLARQGASCDEIMQACDLPRAEAELLISMHAKK